MATNYIIVRYNFIVVAEVRFVSQLYKYFENHGDVTDINVVLNTSVIQGFNVTVSGGNYYTGTVSEIIILFRSW